MVVRERGRQVHMAAGLSGCEYRKLMVSFCDHGEQICVP